MAEDIAGGIALPPDGGRKIRGGGIDATVKAVMADGAFAATFEVVVPPGYDVGVHLHTEGAEIFYVVEGQLDVLAFEPLDRSVPDWHEWKSKTGETFLHGGPGSFLFVPPNTPHAFANTSDETTRMFFQSSASSRHEKYFEELASLLASAGGPPDEAAIADLRRRYDIEQITELADGR